jgi:hypothetical protein
MRSFALALSRLAVSAGTALADETGGAYAPGGSAGGATYGSQQVVVNRPVARLAVPASIREGSAPSIRVLFTEKGVHHVIARVVVLRVSDGAPVARISLGHAPVGRTLSVPWPRGVRLAPGQYLVRVHAHDGRNHQLARSAAASGKATVNVTAAPAPDPAPKPSGKGVFPVAGWHTFGDRFGAPRSGYSHQGQDILASQGTPIVAPLGGTISSVAYQASAAGEYIVLNANDGHAYFFAHCVRHSTVVSAGQQVVAGARLCDLGQTGDATGPHLHFEEWVNGWRTGSASKPVDPMPQLKAWDS